MNNQEAFDKVLAHLRNQGQAAMERGMCMYRAEDGCMCAIGCLIPDEEYSDEFEGNVLYKIIDDIPSLDGLDATLLYQMQSAHDGYLCHAGIEAWEVEMARIADRYGLKINTH